MRTALTALLACAVLAAPGHGQDRRTWDDITSRREQSRRLKEYEERAGAQPGLAVMEGKAEAVEGARRAMDRRLEALNLTTLEKEYVRKFADRGVVDRRLWTPRASAATREKEVVAYRRALANHAAADTRRRLNRAPIYQRGPDGRWVPAP
jgi:hypothetical protein